MPPLLLWRLPLFQQEWALDISFGSGATAAQGIQLTVPATTKKVAAKQYKTTLTWILMIHHFKENKQGIA